jgi:hypothetical protein
MAIEAWVLAALSKKPANPESVVGPAMFLVKGRKLPRHPSGQVMKPLPLYERFASRIVALLTSVRRRCPEAQRFCAKIEAVRDAAA